ncbi:Kinesin-like protein KIN-14I [Camellia lanceoleosa]|uniref:Kinesin-like protein KIN-14I n=1 Tax=Camellia lanceoleosa TaxID=1840588 RepID=A0ACC0I2G7_9ERIC|nr:Kinesin-like protein KIN-14I [Camellia lanceoleosa]
MTVVVALIGRDLTSGTIFHGYIHLVVLAGSERVDKSKKNSHVPYSNNKLTQLLQDSLGGQAKTLMFVHISPELDAVGEIISTLKFAERVATIELGVARVNKGSVDVKELKEQVLTLSLIA